MAEVEIIDAEQKRAENEKTWQWRVINHTRGSQSMMGSIIIAALRKSTSVLSRKNIFTSLARVDKDGILHATFIDKYGVIHPDMPVIRTKDLSDALCAVAERSHLNDAEATEFFTTVRQWIKVDERATSGI